MPSTKSVRSAATASPTRPTTLADLINAPALRRQQPRHPHDGYDGRATTARATRSVWRPAPNGSLPQYGTRQRQTLLLYRVLRVVPRAYRSDGQNADPAKAPHVINNSWYCSTGEGCVDMAVDELLRQAVIINVAYVGCGGGGQQRKLRLARVVAAPSGRRLILRKVSASAPPKATTPSPDSAAAGPDTIDGS
jgi:hypothetical protein